MMIGLEVAENSPLYRRFCTCVAQKPRQLFNAFLLERAHGRSNGAAQAGGVELIFLSSARDRESLGFKPLRHVLNSELACFAGEFSGGAQFVQPGREAFQLGGRSFFFKQKHDDRVGFDTVQGLRYESSLHSLSLLNPGRGGPVRPWLPPSFRVTARSRACRETFCLCRPPVPP